MKLSVIPLLSFMSLTGALIITEPKEGAEVKRSGSVTVAWTFVPTDATNFTLSIRQRGDSSGKAVKALPGVVQVKDKKATIDGSVFANEGNYTIYAVSTDSKNGILAESQVFEAKGPASKTPSSSTPVKSGASASNTDSSGSSAPTSSTTTTKASKSLAAASTVSAGFVFVAGAVAFMAL